MGPVYAEPSRTERIPQMLQHVFLQSNRGKEVHIAPPQRQAHRAFFGNWIYRRDKKLEEVKKKEYNKNKDKVLKRSRKEAVQAAAMLNLTSLENQSPPKREGEIPSKREPRLKAEPEKTLQEHVDAALRALGYNIELYESLTTGFYNPPTPLQVASYGPRMVQIVRSSDDRALRNTLDVGLSPNPCNQFGESLLHMICRRGDFKLLNVMMEAGTRLQVCDDYGRTPLHDAFWSAHPAFEVVDAILGHDPSLLFMKDKRGSLPLSYVHKDHWPAWRQWFDRHIAEYFPKTTVGQIFQPSELVLMEPGSMIAPDPKSELSLELLRMVASGEMDPQEARIMAETNADDDTTVAATDVDDQSTINGDMDEDDDDDSDYSSDDDESDLDMDDDEMRELMEMAQIGRTSS